MSVHEKRAEFLAATLEAERKATEAANFGFMSRAAAEAEAGTNLTSENFDDLQCEAAWKDAIICKALAEGKLAELEVRNAERQLENQALEIAAAVKAAVDSIRIVGGIGGTLVTLDPYIAAYKSWVWRP